MKKYIMTLVLSLVFNTFFAQSVLDKYNGKDGVTSIIVSKKMFQMMSNVKVDANDKETQKYLNLIKKLDNLKVFTTSDAKIAADMKLSAEQYNKTAGLEEMGQTNTNGKSVKMWAKSGLSQDQIKELLMYSEDASKGNETVLLSLTGDFTLSEMAILTDKMNLPAGNDLKNAAKAK